MDTCLALSGTLPLRKKPRAFLVAALTCVFLAPAQLAQAADYISYSQPCSYYGGHVDVEGKFGKRDIGEVSVFMPIACSETKLLFTDIRFRGDNQSNREGNFGLGMRFLQDDGVFGTYAYFDRKESGITDKLHSQLTLGTEFLAENWDIRGNAYVPLTGAKTVDKGSRSISDPYLQGTGIFIDQVLREQTIREKPLYGGDIEAGFKVTDTDLWLHAAAFTFGASDAPQINGIRSRATYKINDFVSLNAEGQYDNERGRMGWVGAKFTVPIGGNAPKHEGLKARMTDSPVRDVDIVTSTKVVKQSSSAETIAVLNKETGVVQRVLYVDNTAASGGDGSKENPFNSLTSAQTALADHDVIYVHSGSGTGLDTGFTITKDGVQLIGAGTNFVYDNDKFTAAINGAPHNGKILIAAGAAPVLTAGSDVVEIRGKDTRIGGFEIVDSGGSGIFVYQSNIDYGDILLHDLVLTGHAYDGIEVATFGSASIGTLTVQNIVAENNGRYGMSAGAAGGTIDSIIVQNMQANNNDRGLIFNSESGGHIGTIDVNRFSAAHNSENGFMIYLQGNGSLDSASIRNTSLTNNATTGAFIMTSSGHLGSVSIENMLTADNGSYGLFAKANGSSALFDSLDINGLVATGNKEGAYLSTGTSGILQQATIRNSDITGSVNQDLLIDAQDGGAAGVLNVDLGTAASKGNNSIGSLFYGYNDRELSAQGNWWGDASGPQAGQITKKNAGSSDSVDFDNWLLGKP